VVHFEIDSCQPCLHATNAFLGQKGDESAWHGRRFRYRGLLLHYQLICLFLQSVQRLLRNQHWIQNMCGWFETPAQDFKVGWGGEFRRKDG